MPDSGSASRVPISTTAVAAQPTVALERRSIAALAIGIVIVHLVTALVTPYEMHRDELLYLAMGEHLRLFAMDFPPMIALLARAERALFGDVIWSIRLAPALAHGALLVLTALLTWRLGGGRVAQWLAVIPVAVAPLYLRAGSLFQPVVFDQLWWTLALYAIVRLATDADWATSRGTWLVLGAALGLGLLTKFTMLALGFGILCAVLLTRRDWLRRRGLWVAAALALLIGAPSFIGQFQLGLPVFNQMDDLRATQLHHVSYGQFVVELMLMHGPLAFALAGAGAIALLAARRYARWRVAGLAALIPALIIMLLHGKPYYIGPVFPLFYAAGAVMVAGHVRRRSVRVATAVLLAAWGLLVLPISLPILPPAPTARFATQLGGKSAVTTNAGVVLELPQDFADMLGWERKVARIAEVYRALPEGERRDAVIVTANYGQAGAVDFYGPRYGLPKAVAPIGSYWFWGPGEQPGNVLIKVGDEAEDLRPFCGSVELATRIDEPWVVPEERNLGIWICRQPHRTLQQIWPMFRGQN